MKKFLKSSQDRKPIKTQCLSEETIACYLDNLLGESEKEKAERHLAWCEPCLEQVIQYNRIKKGEALEKAPARLIKKASALIEKEGKKIDIILEFIQDSLRVIKKSFDISILPGELAQVTVRGEKQDTYSGSVNFAKKVNDIFLEIGLERVKKDSANLTVKPLDNNKNIIKGLRLNLFCDMKELASYVVEEENIIFENLIKKKYSITVTRKGEKIGELTLKLQ